MDYKIIAAIIGLLGGVVGSFMTPFVKWDIEKRKLRRQSRIDKIKFWRDEIDQHEDFSTFFKTQTFNELRPLFTKEEQNSWNVVWHGVYLNQSTPDDRLKTLKFHSKVSELEKEWKII
jgi:hypothetical protein